MLLLLFCLIDKIIFNRYDKVLLIKSIIDNLLIQPLLMIPIHIPLLYILMECILYFLFDIDSLLLPYIKHIIITYWILIPVVYIVLVFKYVLPSLLSSSSSSSSSSLRSSLSLSNKNIERYDSGDIAMLVLQCARNKNSTYIEIPLLLEILRYADVLPKRRRSYQSSILLHKPTNNEDTIYCSYIICSKVKLFQPKAITITIFSKDQGWSDFPNEHGQRTSHTWCELSIHNIPRRFFICRNIHAGKSIEKQMITYDINSPVLQSVLDNFASKDYIVMNIHSRSQYPGWLNIITSASINIDFDFSDTAIPAFLNKYNK